MARRLVAVVPCANRTIEVRILRCGTWDDYIVRPVFVASGSLVSPGSEYFTSDKSDALATARTMASQFPIDLTPN